MATYTENYNLEKPAQSDLYNIDVFNENADKIDEALGSKASNQSLAPIESSATASRNYSVGQQFVYNGLLYEATSAIASGGTITPGSNCARTTVAEELSALNDSLANMIDINDFYFEKRNSRIVSAVSTTGTIQFSGVTSYSSLLLSVICSGKGTGNYSIYIAGNTLEVSKISGVDNLFTATRDVSNNILKLTTSSTSSPKTISATGFLATA